MRPFILAPLDEEDKRDAVNIMVAAALAAGHGGTGMASALEALMKRFDLSIKPEKPNHD